MDLPSDIVDAPEVNLQRLTALAALELGGPSLDAVLQQIADVATTLLPASLGASVILWDPVLELYQLGASTVPDEDSDHVVEGVRTRGGATRWIIDQRRPHICTDTTIDRFGPSANAVEVGVGAYVGVPIVANDRVLGVLYALEDAPREYDDSDIAFLTTLARRAGTALVDARLHEANRLALRRTETMAQVSQALVGVSDLEEVLTTIIDGVSASLDADQVYLVTFDRSAERVERVHAGGPGVRPSPSMTWENLMRGLTGWVVRTGQTALSPQAVPDQRESTALQRTRAETGTGSVVVAPLSLDGDVVGTLTAHRPRLAPDFTPDDAATLEGLATLAAVAIENARLSGEMRSALTEVRGMYKIMTALNTEGGIVDLLSRLADLVAEVLPAERVAFYLLEVEKREVYRIIPGGPRASEIRTDLSFEGLWTGLPGWVIRNRRPTMSPGDRPDARHGDVPGSTRPDGMGPVLAVPLFHRGDALGVLMASRGSDDAPFAQRDLDLTGAMAGQISVAVANARLLEELQRLAITDELTQVPNRRHLFELGARAFATSVRYGNPVSAILFDLDEFKRINDTHGHAVGDEVLAAVVQRCLPVVREVDVLGRYGGEEFAVILPQTPLVGAVETAERLRAAVGRAPLPTAVGGIEVTISAGVATRTDDVHDVHHLLDRADAAMFLAKHLGRNRVATG